MAESAPQQAQPTVASVTSITVVVLGARGSERPRGDGDPGTRRSPATPHPGSELTARPPAPGRRPSATPTYDWLRCDTTGADCAGHQRAPAAGATRSARPTRATRCACGSRPPSPNGQAASARLGADRGRARQALRDPAPTTETDTCTKVTPTGPGQGTFSSGTQVGARLRAGAGHLARRSSTRSPSSASPGRFKGKRTTLTRVTVKAPNGTRIRINCKGRGCPYKRKARRGEAHHACARCSAPIARRRRSRSGSRSRRRSASTRASARAAARRRCASTAA